MTKLVHPHGRPTVMQLVKTAGVDVSDWTNFKGGKSRAASNPKFCYEWSFVEPGKVVVLNLWFEGFRRKGGIWTRRLTFTKEEIAGRKHIQIERTTRFVKALQVAYQEGLPVRVILCDGERQDGQSVLTSRVTARSLDDETWAVTSFDERVPAYVLSRGVQPKGANLAPLLQDEELESLEGLPRERLILHRIREWKLRKRKLDKAFWANGGRLVCEVPNCGFNFSERYGALGDGYCHVHHLTPLSDAPDEGRAANLDDLAIVCANCHAMIHRNGGCRPLVGLIPQKR